MDEDEVIIRIINEQTQTLIDCQEMSQKALIKLQEGLQALRDYHSREIIKGVLDGTPF
jgi:hypothetical protein